MGTSNIVQIFISNFFEKSLKKTFNSGKQQGFEQSYLEARFATPERTLTVSTTGLRSTNFLNLFEIYFLKKSEKTSYLENYQKLRNEI